MKKSTQTEQVETWLRAERSYNEDKKIWTSHNVVIDRLLADHVNMEKVYAELLEKLPSTPYGLSQYGMTGERWHLVMDAIVEVAAGWHPDKIKTVRDDVKSIGTLNADIKKTASKLAALLRKRSQICERSNVTRPLDYHPLDLLEPAAKISDVVNPSPGGTHYLYSTWVKASIDEIHSRFDFKYWPGTADLIDALAEAQDVEPGPGDRLDAAALETQQAGVRDFLRPFAAALSDLKRYGFSIEFSAESMAVIANCALSLAEPLDPKNVNVFRSNERKRNEITNR